MAPPPPTGAGMAQGGNHIKEKSISPERILFHNSILSKGILILLYRKTPEQHVIP